MANVTIRIENLDALVARFGMADKTVRLELERAMTRAVVGELGRMPSYPPPPPASTYRRTGYLGRSLTTLVGSAAGAASEVDTSGATIRGIIGTNVQYARQVIGPTQAKPFRGRWWMLDTSVISHKPELEAEFADATKRIVEALGD